MNLFTATPTNAEDDDRLDGILYNACYMLEWQIKRVQSGTWDAYSARLLHAGVQQARKVLHSGKVYGRFTPMVIEQLIAAADALMSERSAA